MILVSKFMVHRALSDKTYLSFKRRKSGFLSKMMEYFDTDSQQKHELTDVETIASNKESIVGGEDADASIVRTNEIAKGTRLEASSCCQAMEYMSSCKRPMGHQEQTVLQGQVELKETLVSVTVALKGALKNQNLNGQKQKKM